MGFFTRRPKPERSKVQIIELPALKGFLRDDQPLLDSLHAVAGADSFVKLAREFEHWPRDSVISAYERAVLHWLIGETRAREVLEIGTSFAGTTLLLSASMQQVGAGKVYTIDPYGEARAPQILAGWPKALQEITVFQPKFSSDFFVPNVDIPAFDVVLVDGAHSYPNVMHDLFAAYEGLKYGGFIVADNAEQVDVLDAVRDFRKLTPGADLARLSVGARQESGDYAFEVDCALEPNESRSAFVVIRKPREVQITRRALAFHLNQFRSLSLTSLQASVINPQDRPILLKGKINLRSLSLRAMDATAHDLGEVFEADIAPGRHELSFPFHSLQLPAEAADGRNFVEANLFTARDGDVLVLDAMKINGITVKPGRNTTSAKK